MTRNWSVMNIYSISSDHSSTILMIMKQRSIYMFPPTIFYTLAIANILLGLILSTPKLFFFPFNLFGLLPLVIGIIINVWTDSLFKRYKTTVKPNEVPTTLITTGPFSFSRHPMYLGMGLILMGEAILLGSLINFLIPIIYFILIQKFFISFEEETLIAWFPEDYKKYKNRVRQWM
jgi:protein-S-isoprenylcysteine O-methyltransferase Ste14